MKRPLSEMDAAQAVEWITDIRTRLQRKQIREQAYLARRRFRGVRTPTDEAFESDQQLETELLLLLDELEQGARA